MGPQLLAVADGMGGMAAGDLASAIVIAALAPLDEAVFGPEPADDVAFNAFDGPTDGYTTVPLRQEQETAPVGDAVYEGTAGLAAAAPGGAIAALREAVERANERLREAVAADPARRGMGTTLTALVVTGDDLAMVHIGDSRAYLLRDGELYQVTRDDTFVQLLVDDGHITAEEAETHPQRFLVTKALQGSGTPAEYSLRSARHGDRYLLCSDGLSGVVSFEAIHATLRDYPDVDRCVDRLVELALDGGAPDNVTVVVSDLLFGESGTDGSAILGAAATV